MSQMTFSDYEYSLRKRKTKREKTEKEYPAPAGTPGQTAGQPTVKETESIQESQKTDKK